MTLRGISVACDRKREMGRPSVICAMSKIPMVKEDVTVKQGRMVLKGGRANVPNQAGGFSPHGYNPKPGERTLDGYVRNNVPADVETKLYTGSSGFNTSTKNIDGQFKRFGTDGHSSQLPDVHVHQPTRNVAPDGTIYGGQGTKTGNGGVTLPNSKDVKQLYEYLNNGKYQKGNGIEQ